MTGISTAMEARIRENDDLRRVSHFVEPQGWRQAILSAAKSVGKVYLWTSP